MSATSRWRRITASVYLIPPRSFGRRRYASLSEFLQLAMFSQGVVAQAFRIRYFASDP
jgi:hypothetical protein